MYVKLLPIRVRSNESFWVVFDVLIDGLSHGNLVEEAAGVIFDLLDSLPIKVLSGIELISQAVDNRKLGVKFLLFQVEFLPVIFVDLQSLLLGHLHVLVLLVVVLNAVDVGLVRRLILNLFFESLEVNSSQNVVNLLFVLLGDWVSKKLVHILLGCVPLILVDQIRIFFNGTNLEPLIDCLLLSQLGIINVEGFDSSHSLDPGILLLPDFVR